MPFYFESYWFSENINFFLIQEYFALCKTYDIFWIVKQKFNFKKVVNIYCFCSETKFQILISRNNRTVIKKNIKTFKSQVFSSDAVSLEIDVSLITYNELQIFQRYILWNDILKTHWERRFHLWDKIYKLFQFNFS